MRIVLAADHGGFHLKEHVKQTLLDAGHEITDVGADSADSVDYPPLAEQAARAVAAGEADLGVLACGSGVGVSIVANKVDGVRAVNAHSADEAELARRHNDANVVALGGRGLGPEQADAIVLGFLRGNFEGGRHARRVAQIAAVESNHAPAGRTAG